MSKKLLFILGYASIGIGAIGLALMAAWFLSPTETNANPSRVQRCSTSASSGETHATGTLNYMRAGTATTTLPCSIDGTDQVDLLVILKASSTATTLRWRYEFSADNVNWYIGDSDIVPTEASSTVRVPSTFTEYSWVYASSTPESSAGNADTAFKRIQIKDLGARYMRVKFYLPVGSLNGAVYAEMLRKEQHR